MGCVSSCEVAIHRRKMPKLHAPFAGPRPEIGGAWGRSSRALSVEIALALWLACGLSLSAPVSSSFGALPNNRAYELVSRVTEGNGESLFGEPSFEANRPFFVAADASGEVVDWESLGTCCEARGGGLNTYQAHRGPTGWQSRSITPVPAAPLTGLEELQEAVSWNEDLGETLLSTSASYVPGDERTSQSGGSDLYLRSPSGALTWISQGPEGNGTGPYPTRYAGATPNLGEIAFTTAEPLTAQATGLAALPAARYLYVRNTERETTNLVDIGGNGQLLSPYGASLGDAGPPKEGLLYLGFRGTTTNAISEDGSKVFFETPPAGIRGLPAGVEPHLYMRELTSDTTTPLDDPSAGGSALFQGASANGSLVFFTSNEGLDGASTANELYVFNTTTSTIGQVPPMSSIPAAAGIGIGGVTAIANDGSRVYFVTDGALAANENSVGSSAVLGEPNLYVYDTGSGETKFIATLSPTDVSDCKPTCSEGEPSGLLGPADIYRSAYTTADGSVLVFTSSANLTGQAHTPSTTLTQEAGQGERTISVAGTAGFIPNRIVAIDSGEREELQRIEKIDGPTQMTLSEYGPSHHYGLLGAHQAGASVVLVNSEIYRYAAASGGLSCVSCTPPGVLSTQSASLGEVRGGGYAFPGHTAQMGESGSEIFFDSPDPLVAGASEPNTARFFEPTNLYEWGAGTVSLIANAADGGAVFDGTTPSGDDVFFTSRNALVPEAVAGPEHIYDARANGGFPVEAPSMDPCAEEPCRPFTAVTPLVPPLASADLGGSGAPPRGGPTFTVAPITAAARVELARGGRIALTIKATAPGEVTASATATLHGRRAFVGQGSIRVSGANEGVLVVRLSRAARTTLATQGTLTLRLEVRYRGTGTAGKGTVDLITIRASAYGHSSSARGDRHG